MKGIVAAIVLAAGASRRLGQPKQLLMLDGETLLARSVRLAREAGAAPVLVVVGAQAALIGAGTPVDRATVVLNDEWEQGIASSIHAGVKGLDASARGVSGSACSEGRQGSAFVADASAVPADYASI